MGGYSDPRALCRLSSLGRGALERLAEADAFRSTGLDRRRALWALKGLGEPPLPLFAAVKNPPPPLPPADAPPPPPARGPPPPPPGRGGGGGGRGGAGGGTATEARAMAL